jgi:hypothetical protein
MKKIFYTFAIAFMMTSCATTSKNQATSANGYPTAYWVGGDGVLVIKDTSGKEVYEPVNLKRASKRKLRKMESKNK